MDENGIEVQNSLRQVLAGAGSSQHGADHNDLNN
jgi:hypothetical protein